MEERKAGTEFEQENSACGDFPGGRRYYAYSEALKKQYGEKGYKLPLSIGAGCPNRDGTKGEGGCAFCGARGTGFENLSAALSVSLQLRKNAEHISKRYKARKFIAYFQDFSNTYLPLDEFSQRLLEAALPETEDDPDVVELCVSTRPDCVSDRYLSALLEAAVRGGEARGKSAPLNVCVELGLQTVNYHTLKAVNRGHGLAEYIDAVLRIQRFGFSVCTHVILNLPGDEDSDAIETAKILSALGTDYVKLHALYIEKGTEFCRKYEAGELSLISMEAYMDRAVLFLEHLDPRIAVERLAGRAPESDTVFCNWGTSWWKIKEGIEERLQNWDTYQGKHFHYLNGDYEMTHGRPNEAGREREPILILWDIDGTLMHCGGDGVKALNQAFEELYGISDAFAKARIGHAMDGAIVEELMEEFALDVGDLPKVKSAYAKALEQILDRNQTKRVLPGILELMEALREANGVYNGILTSNLRIGAAIKLKAMGLFSYFRFRDYEDLCREKWEEALREIRDQEELHGVTFSKERIFLVGDTVYDVETAKRLKARSVAVGTGWASMEALATAGPDYLFENFLQTEEFLNVLEDED